MKKILAKLRRNFTGQTLSRIAVEVGEVEDVKLLVESRTVDWKERVEGEETAIFWALNNEMVELFKILLPEVDPNLKNNNGYSLEKAARLVAFLTIQIFEYLFHCSDRLLEGREVYKDFLKIIPGTVEYDNRQNLLKIRQLEKCVKEVCYYVIKTIFSSLN